MTDVSSNIAKYNQINFITTDKYISIGNKSCLNETKK